MKTFLLFFVLFYIDISFAQSKNDFLSKFTFQEELKPKNLVDDFVDFDYSKILLHTKNNSVLGIIGKNHQRIRVKLISVIKDSTLKNKYTVNGKSYVKGTICDFSGTITILKIKEYKNFQYGVDGMYANQLNSQGILIAKYEFKENTSQKHSGIFKGKFYSKWYLDKKEKLHYDNILSQADGYYNNAFIGIWISNKMECLV